MEKKPNVKQLLNEEIASQIEEIKNLEVGTEKYKIAVDGLTKLLDKLNEMDKIDLEYDTNYQNRELEKEMKVKTIESEEKMKKKELLSKNVDNVVKNLLTVGTFAAGVAVTIWGTKASFEFEKEGTITTIMGRGFINKLLHKN